MDDFTNEIQSDEFEPLTNYELDEMYPCMGCEGTLMSPLECRHYCPGCPSYKTPNESEDLF